MMNCDRPTLTWFERWILKRIARKLIPQGFYSKGKITHYYQIMADVAREHYREDNDSTLHDFLAECHENASKSVMPHISKGLLKRP